MDWQRYEAQEPWGESRADMRSTAHTLVQMGDGKDIILMHPYFKDADELYEKHRELEKRAADPAHQAKLKEARRKHIEAMKNRGA